MRMRDPDLIFGARVCFQSTITLRRGWKGEREGEREEREEETNVKEKKTRDRVFGSVRRNHIIPVFRQFERLRKRQIFDIDIFVLFVVSREIFRVFIAIRRRNIIGPSPHIHLLLAVLVHRRLLIKALRRSSHSARLSCDIFPVKL